MRRGVRIALRTLACVAGLLVTLLLLSVPVANLLLSSSLKDKFLSKYVPEPFSVTIAHADISLWRTFPHLRLRLRDTDVRYAAGGGADIALRVDSLVGRVDYVALLDGKVNINVDTLIAHGEGVGLRLGASVGNLAGEDPHCRVDVRLDADMSSVSDLLGHYLTGISAAGSASAYLHADVSVSDFDADRLCRADIRGELRGDALQVRADSIWAYLLNPYVEIAPKPNIIKTQPEALALFATLDSLSLGIGEDIRADLGASKVMAQSAVEPIDSIPIPPVVGWLVTQRLYFRGSDSLAVDVRGADIDYTVRRQDGGTLPFVKLGAGFEGIGFVNEACTAVLESLRLTARASMKPEGQRGDWRRRPRMAEGDSLAAPLPALDSSAAAMADASEPPTADSAHAASPAASSGVARAASTKDSSAAALADAPAHSPADSSAMAMAGASAASPADSFVSAGLPPAGRQMPDFLSDKTFRASDIDIRLDRSLADMLDKWEPFGRIRLGGGAVELPALPLDNRINVLSARFESDVLTLDKFSFSSGNSDIGVSGKLQGLLRALTHGGVLRADVDVTSDNVNVTELLAALKEGSAAARGADGAGAKSGGAGVQGSGVESATVAADLSASEGLAGEDGFSTGAEAGAAADSSLLVVIPANVIADMRVDVRNVRYDTLLFNDIRGELAMRQRTVRLSGVHASSDFGHVDLDGFYSTRTRQDISAGFDLRLGDITADRVIALVPQFDTLMPLLKSFKGNLNVEVAATSKLDTGMRFMLPTVNGMFNIRGEGLVVDEIGKLKRFTRLLMFRHKNHIDIDNLDVYGTITDNELKLFPFILSVDRYSMALNGRQDFGSGSFKYKMSLLKSILPFKLGAKFYGQDYSRYKIRLSNPQYTSGKVPDYSAEVDSIRTQLRTSIARVFDMGTDRAILDVGRRSRSLEDRLSSDGYDTEPETELSDSRQAMLRKMGDEAGGDSPLYVAPSESLVAKARANADTAENPLDRRSRK